MGWIAAVLGIFLFYRYVERTHKIIIFKILGALGLFGVVVGGGIWIYSSLSQDNPKKGIRIKDVYANKALDKEIKTKIVFKLFDERAKQDKTLLKMSAENQEIIRWVLFPYYEKPEELRKKVFKRVYGRESEIFSWDDFDKFLKEEAIREREKYIPQYLKDLSSIRAAISGPDDEKRMVAEAILFQRYQSLQTENRELFKKSLNQAETELFERLQGVSDDTDERYLEEQNRFPGKTSLSATICNDRRRPMKSARFYVAGLNIGRSTKNALFGDGRDSNGDPATELSSDYIVQPGACKTLNWELEMKLFPKYEVTAAFGTWEQ